MTSQSPRIYLYKITFEEVLYYYYGVHKEKKFNEYYMGSPITHKWMWDFYTPKKQILEIFEFGDEGWLEAQEVEKRLIKPVYNTDEWCLNESCGGVFSLDQKSKAGKIGGKKLYELKLGIYSQTLEQRSEIGKMGGKKSYELKSGIHGITKEQRIEYSKNGGKKSYELGLGLYNRSPQKIREDCKKGAESLTKEQRSNSGKKGGKRSKELKSGIHGITKEQRIEYSKKGGKSSGMKKWECCETGYVSNAPGVVRFQKARGIDTSKSNRRRIA
jgi:general stress protein YciG